MVINSTDDLERWVTRSLSYDLTHSARNVVASATSVLADLAKLRYGDDWSPVLDNVASIFGEAFALGRLDNLLE